MALGGGARHRLRVGLGRSEVHGRTPLPGFAPRDHRVGAAAGGAEVRGHHGDGRWIGTEADRDLPVASLDAGLERRVRGAEPAAAAAGPRFPTPRRRPEATAATGPDVGVVAALPAHAELTAAGGAVLIAARPTVACSPSRR